MKNLTLSSLVITTTIHLLAPKSPTYLQVTFATQDEVPQPAPAPTQLVSAWAYHYHTPIPFAIIF